MIVLFNVKITDVRMGYPYRRAPWMPNPERMDVFKYCLASHAVMAPIVDKFVFCITLAPELAHRQAELEEYMQGLFPAGKLDITWARNDYSRDWKQTCDRVLTDPNQVVWLAANDDHIFIDSGLDVVRAAITTLKEDSDPNAIMYYSHWPEQMRMAHHLKGQLTADGNFIKYQWENFDGIMMLKAGRLNSYWRQDFGNALMFKPDYLGAHHNFRCQSNVYAPTKELVRHYEGYSHVNDSMAQTLENIVPPLYVPKGFFGTGIEIRIGYPNRDDTWVNFNPAAEWLYNSKPTGTDYRWVREDIPLFWKDRIVWVDVNPNYDVEANYQARNTAFLLSTHVPMKCFGIEFGFNDGPPKEWFAKHLLSI